MFLSDTICKINLLSIIYSCVVGPAPFITTNSNIPLARLFLCTSVCIKQCRVSAVENSNSGFPARQGCVEKFNLVQSSPTCAVKSYGSWSVLILTLMLRYVASNVLMLIHIPKKFINADYTRNIPCLSSLYCQARCCRCSCYVRMNKPNGCPKVPMYKHDYFLKKAVTDKYMAIVCSRFMPMLPVVFSKY